MPSKKQSKSNGLYMKIYCSHELVAQAIFRHVVFERKLEGHVAMMNEWVAESVLIDHRLRPWQVAFLLRYLPTKGDVVGWLVDEDETADSRLQNVFESIVTRRFRKEITLEEAEQAWRVEMEPRDLTVQDTAVSATVSGRFEMERRSDGVQDD